MIRYCNSLANRRRISFLLLCTIVSVSFVYTFFLPEYRRVNFDYKKKSNEIRMLKKSENRDIPDIPWYRVPTNSDPRDKCVILVTSAFYDHRINKIAVFVAPENASMRCIWKEFVCILIYNKSSGNNTTIVKTEGHFFSDEIFHCPLTNNIINRIVNVDNDVDYLIPNSLSIQRKDTFHSLFSFDWTLPIIDLLDAQKSHRYLIGSFAMCVGILFGHQDWLTLLQYIEFHRLQGVEKFVFFYHDMCNSTREILQWYMREFDNIELVEWKPNPVICPLDKNGQYFCQNVRDNICTYSLMYKYKYVGHSDFDELFFPSKNNELIPNLLNRIDRHERGSFLFIQKYHQRLVYDNPEWYRMTGENVTDVVGNFLPILRYNNVSSFVPNLLSPKSIAKPETVLRRTVHTVAVHTAGTSIYFVDGHNDGYLRHFKIREWWGEKWSRHAEQLVKFNIVDSETEIGKTLLSLVIKNVQSIAYEIKLFNDDGDRGGRGDNGDRFV